MNWRYAPIILAPAGGSGAQTRDASDQTAAVRASKHINFFGATRQKSTILGPKKVNFDYWPTSMGLRPKQKSCT